MTNAAVIDSGNWNLIAAFDKNSIVTVMNNGITHYFGH